MPAKNEVKNEMKNDTLPVEITDVAQSNGNVVYANEVIATIAGVAANEVEGIAGMYSAGGISEILGKNRNITRGVKVEIGTEEASVDLYVIIEYGTPIHKAAQNAQENVKKAIETMTGLHVVRVDVHVQGVSFEKETKALERGAENAALPVTSTKHLEEKEKAAEKIELDLKGSKKKEKAAQKVEAEETLEADEKALHEENIAEELEADQTQ